MFGTISKAFNPLIEMLQAASYPLAFICMALGILTILIGQKMKGMQVIKWAAIGYLLMQFLPSIMQMLHQVGQAMKP